MPMHTIRESFFDLGYLDTIAGGDSRIHRLDPRAKLIATLLFIVTVVSFEKHAVSALVPFCIFPVAMISLAGLPAGYIFRKVLLISPVAVLIALCNPLIDRQVALRIGPVAVSEGWVSFTSILARFLLTATAALVLLATTGFNAVCLGLSKLGLPRPFVVQLMFLYRYIFVLMEEAERLVRASSLRSLSSRPMQAKTFVSLVGHLLLRTLERAQRIYLAMRCRGFDGTVRVIKTLKRGPAEIIFVLFWALVFIALRYSNIPLQLGALLTRSFS